MAITQVGIPFINKNKLNLFLNYTIVEVGDVINFVSESDAYSIIRALEKSKENKLPVLLFSNNQDYIYILSYSEGYGVYQVNGIGSFQDANRVIYYRYTLGTDPSGAFHHEVKTYDLLTTEDAKKYAKLDSENTFNNLKTFSEVQVNNYLDINYPDIDIIRISENANSQLQFDFSRVGGGTTVLPHGSANNTATIITTENIADNVANKVDKLKNESTTKSRIYGVYPNATTPVLLDSGSSESPSSLVWRNNSGKASIETPTDSDSVKSIANVEYVKNYVTNNSSKLTVTDNEDGTLTLSF